MLEALDISLNIGQKKLLTHISLSIKPAELVAICGPNGAGKSTLMRLFQAKSIQAKAKSVGTVNQLSNGQPQS